MTSSGWSASSLCWPASRLVCRCCRPARSFWPSQWLPGTDCASDHDRHSPRHLSSPPRNPQCRQLRHVASSERGGPAGRIAAAVPPAAPGNWPPAEPFGLWAHFQRWAWESGPLAAPATPPRGSHHSPLPSLDSEVYKYFRIYLNLYVVLYKWCPKYKINKYTLVDLLCLHSKCTCIYIPVIWY